jgi:hypothetical protein
MYYAKPAGLPCATVRFENFGYKGNETLAEAYLAFYLTINLTFW